MMLATTMPPESMMSPQSPGALAVRKRRFVALLQHCGPPVVLVVDEVLVVLLLVVGVGPDVDEVLDVLVLVLVGAVVRTVELVDVVVLPATDEELVELVLVVVEELPPIVVVEPPTDVDVVELVVVVEPPSDVEVVDGVACEVLVVDGRMVVVVGLPGFFSDGTQRSEALRHVPLNAVTSCSVNWSSTDTSRWRKSGCPTASTMR